MYTIFMNSHSLFDSLHILFLSVFICVVFLIVHVNKKEKKCFKKEKMGLWRVEKEFEQNFKENSRKIKKKDEVWPQEEVKASHNIDCDLILPSNKNIHHKQVTYMLCRQTCVQAWVDSWKQLGLSRSRVKGSWHLYQETAQIVLSGSLILICSGAGRQDSWPALHPTQGSQQLSGTRDGVRIHPNSRIHTPPQGWPALLHLVPDPSCCCPALPSAPCQSNSA